MRHRSLVGGALEMSVELEFELELVRRMFGQQITMLPVSSFGIRSVAT